MNSQECGQKIFDVCNGLIAEASKYNSSALSLKAKYAADRLCELFISFNDAIEEETKAALAERELSVRVALKQEADARKLKARIKRLFKK